jgi:putative pyruvate formate lyase activating enzyme
MIDRTMHNIEEFVPGYLGLLYRGELARRVELAWERLQRCDLCARYCRVDRLSGIKGAICRTGEPAIVHSFGPHHGEEDPLRGNQGSGTIFFSWCNLRCVFCQNWEISHHGRGEPVTPAELAQMMLNLQAQGCHNINLVSPSHVVAQILAAVQIAAEQGLRLPLIYNTGGYDSLEALALLDGVIDIYMPDIKYADSETAQRFSRIRDYVSVNHAAVKEMHRQVGDLILDASRLAHRGLLIRHLVLPGLLDETEKILAFIAGELSHNTYLNLMDQYHPCYRADEFPPLDRALDWSEYQQALVMAENLGLHRLDRRQESS